MNTIRQASHRTVRGTRAPGFGGLMTSWRGKDSFEQDPGGWPRKDCCFRLVGCRALEPVNCSLSLTISNPRSGMSQRNAVLGYSAQEPCDLFGRGVEPDNHCTHRLISHIAHGRLTLASPIPPILEILASNPSRIQHVCHCAYSNSKGGNK